MTSTLRTGILAAALCASLLAFGACRQKEGKSCQTTTDCEKGLVCCYDGTSAASTLGVCTQASECNAQPDAAVPPDAKVYLDAAAQPDAADPPDAQVTVDASVTADASP